MSTVTAQTLNQYVGTDSTGNSTTIVASTMTEACQVYYDQETSDPIMMQCTKQSIKCVLPEIFVTFNTEVYDDTGGAETAGCTATPTTYTVKAGSLVIFTATAAEGWSFVKWQIDGTDVDGDEGTKEVALLEIPSTSAVCTITAVFEATVE